MALVRWTPFLMFILIHLQVCQAVIASSHLIAPRDNLEEGELLDRLQLAKNNDALAPDEKKYISNFVDVSDGEKYGWTHEDWTVTEDRDLMFWQLPGTQDGRANVVTWKNIEDCTFDGRKYKATNGYFETKFNPHAGLIVAQKIASPSALAPYRGIDPNDIVPLNKWSDVVFLQWLDQAKKAGVPPLNIKNIVLDMILNQQTQDVVNGILFRKFGKDKAPPIWEERFTLHADNPSERDDFLRLLQSPNGAGCAFFLAGHKAILGAKRIVSVTIWTDIVPDSGGENQGRDRTIQDPANKQPLRETLQKTYPKFFNLQRQAVQAGEIWLEFIEAHNSWLEEAHTNDESLMDPDHREWLNRILEQFDTQHQVLHNTYRGYQDMLKPIKEAISGWEDELRRGYIPSLYFTVEDVP